VHANVWQHVMIIKLSNGIGCMAVHHTKHLCSKLTSKMTSCN